MDEWMFIPHVVKELSELDDGIKPSFSKKELSELALTCKKIYAKELRISEDSPTRKKLKTSVDLEDELGFDSDATVEMTEEEINLAFQGVGNHKIE